MNNIQACIFYVKKNRIREYQEFLVVFSIIEKTHLDHFKSGPKVRDPSGSLSHTVAARHVITLLGLIFCVAFRMEGRRGMSLFAPECQKNN